MVFVTNLVQNFSCEGYSAGLCPGAHGHREGPVGELRAQRLVVGGLRRGDQSEPVALVEVSTSCAEVEG